MADPVLYASFLVRLWRDPATDIAAEQEPVWMDELESIQTGRAWQFQGLERLLPLVAEDKESRPTPSSEEQNSRWIDRFTEMETKTSC